MGCSTSARIILLHYSLLLAGSLWPFIVWWMVLFGGPDLASLQGEAYFAFSQMAGEPTLWGVAVFALLPLPWRKKALPLVSWCLPFLLISLHYFLRIYVTGK